MTVAELKVVLRKETGKCNARRLRAAGRVPAVIYTPGKETISIHLDPEEMKEKLRSGAGRNTIVKLALDDGRNLDTIIKDFQSDMVYSEQVIHVDFYGLTPDRDVKIPVEVEISGKPEGLKTGALLRQITREIEVMCKPERIPSKIEVNVEKLEIGQTLFLKDVAFPEGVAPTTRLNYPIVSLSMPKAVKEPGAVTAAKAEAEAEAAEAEAPAEGGEAAGKEKAEGVEDKVTPKAEGGKPEEKGKGGKGKGGKWKG